MFRFRRIGSRHVPYWSYKGEILFDWLFPDIILCVTVHSVFTNLFPLWTMNRSPFFLSYPSNCRMNVFQLFSLSLIWFSSSLIRKHSHSHVPSVWICVRCTLTFVPFFWNQKFVFDFWITWKKAFFLWFLPLFCPSEMLEPSLFH